MNNLKNNYNNNIRYSNNMNIRYNNMNNMNMGYNNNMDDIMNMSFDNFQMLKLMNNNYNQMMDMNMSFNENQNMNLNMNNNNNQMANMKQYNGNDNIYYRKINLNKNYNNGFKNNELKDAVEDPLYYINELKKVLKFSTIKTLENGSFIKVKIPISLTKRDLYSIARYYQECYYSNIILAYNNYLLKEDESSIEGIPENSVINIIEDADFPDESYYNKILEKYKNKKFNQIVFDLNSKKHSISLPENIKFDEMEKAVFSKLHLNEKQYKLIIYGTQTFNNYRIDEIGEMCRHVLFGKKIKAFFMYKNKEMNVNIGTLNSIKRLIQSINNILDYKKVIRIVIGMNKYGIKDEKSLSSIGINKDFKCNLEF
jgi:hypothetical protein